MQQHMEFIEDIDFGAYRLDERTKAVGRQGLAAARARLAAIQTQESHPHAA